MSEAEQREQYRAESRAQMARLKLVAATIDRGPNDKYFGADFQPSISCLGRLKCCAPTHSFPCCTAGWPTY